MAADETNERLSFPFKLYTMLQYASNSHYSSAVSWKRDGQSFAIHNRVMFMKQIVPRYFKLTKFPSFTRQLNNWGFTNLNENEWRHKHFIRGNTDDLQLIGRIQIKEPSNSKISDKLGQDTEDTNEEVISLTPSTGRDLSLQAIKFCPEIGNQHSNSRRIPQHPTDTQVCSLPPQSEEDAPAPSIGRDLPLQSIEFRPEKDIQQNINSRRVHSHATTTRTSSLPLDNSSVAFSRPNEDDDLLLMCTFLELEDSMFTGCDCSFCRA